MSLKSESWLYAFPFFRKKRQRILEASRDMLLLPASPGQSGSVDAASAAVNVSLAGAALEPVNTAIKFAAPLAAQLATHNLAPLSMSISMPSLDQVLVRIRNIFGNYPLPSLIPFPPPPPPPPLPAPVLSVVSVTERSVGIGNRIGNETLGAFGVLALKGIRLEVGLRYLLWANSLTEIEDAIQNLIGQLLADRDDLRSKGVLRLALKSVGASEASDNNVWRQTAEFTVLYEEPFTDADGAKSLIAQIPINIDSEFDEKTTITDEMVRWDDTDDTSAPPLIVRGPLQLAALSALYFKPGTAPTGTVTLRRTFDGAAGQPSAHPSFNAFIAAINDPVAPDRNAEFVFNSPDDFLAQFSNAGDPVEFGEAPALDQYKSLALNINPPIKLPLVTERFEIVYEGKKFDEPAVLYLRAAHLITT